MKPNLINLNYFILIYFVTSLLLLSCGDDNDSDSNEESATDGDIDSDSDTDEDSDADADSDSDSVSDSDSDSATGHEQDSEGDSDTGTDGTCTFLCRAENWCTNNDTIIHESMTCAEVEMICCELPDPEQEDTDTQPTDSDTGLDSEGVEYTCEYECHSANWCTTTEATVYYEQTCAGSQICCAAQ